jgi:hypothetical protein
MRALAIFFGLILFSASVYAQYDYNNTYNGPDRYFYNEDFDWRWDVRVRITDGIKTGLLTNREANRLFNHLEQIERREYTFQADGYFSGLEQDEIWDEVSYLNRMIGIELTDWDRIYYGYSVRGLARRGYLPWYVGSSYDFYRFDRRGFGSISIGYSPRAFIPRNHVYYNHRSYSSNWNQRNDSKRNNRNSERSNNWNKPYGNGKGINNNGTRNDNSLNNEKSNNGFRRSSSSQSSRRGSESALQNKSWNPNKGTAGDRNSNSVHTSRESEIQRIEMPQTSTRNSRNTNREEIRTPRPASTTPATTSRGANRSSQENMPKRANENNSRRGNNNQY